MTGHEDLVRRARQAGLNSYSPYSGFRVGAALLAEDGTVYTGTNVENAAYPVSNCAEVTAVNTAVAEGVRRIDTVAVVCLDADSIDDAYPCGGCRQVMNEFAVQTVLVAAGGGPHRVHSLSELLPHGFSGETLLS
ncbi:MAG: cytidine deaminase [bacterium]|nr:cytidine deaminase [Acidimicrobiia bacterium]MCY4649661.1 cytidine deaminase [bacterium]